MTFDKTTLPTLVELNRSTSARVAFCIHSFGGGVAIYQDLARGLEDTVKVYGIEDPHIYGDASFSSVPELAELHIETIRQVQPHGPYLLFANCAAGPIAYEVACQLSMDDEKVDRVVLFGSHHLKGFDPAIKEKYRFLEARLGRRDGTALGNIDWHALETMDMSSACAVIAKAVVSGTPAAKPEDLAWITRSLESLCMTTAAIKRYRAPKSKLNVALFKQIRAEGADAHGHRDWCDWDNLTDGVLTVVDHEVQLPISFDEGGILTQPHVEWVVGKLKGTILGRTHQSHEASAGQVSSPA